MSQEEISPVIQIGDELKYEDIQTLASLLNIPSGLSENVKDGREFLYILKKCKHDRYLFFQGLNQIGRADLADRALKCTWLAINNPEEDTESGSQEELSMKTFVRVLKTEFQRKDWFGISLLVTSLDPEASFEAKVSTLVHERYISKDLKKLTILMNNINRQDIAQLIIKHQPLFSDIPDQLFVSKFDKEVASLEKEIAKWEKFLKKYIKIQQEKVKQLEDDEPVLIESVYVDLTIIKQKPREVQPEDETTYNEIALLRKIANKQIDIKPVDFTKEIVDYDPSTPEIWCMLGNPGSGKTFLCHRTALRFAKGELKQFSYSLSIPCRDPDWHQMELSRDRAEDAINSEFIQKWLCLSMPVGPSWTTDLAKHIVESDGDGLLLIIDSMDEFIKGINFNQTLLYLLLTRKTLTQSSILLTSRPGAYTYISCLYTLTIDRFYQVLGFSPENRDKYFRLQLPDQGKFDQLQYLLYLHEEVKQLSLVPVNASLFAALVRGSDNVIANTLTQLYSELVAYLIRRQLSRMGLKSLSKKKSLSKLDPIVQDCLFRIGEIAYLGIFSRELTCSKDILLKLGKVEKACQCLGLAEEHVKKDNLGRITRVWSFAHLTMQEFVGAFWLSKSSWGDQCLSTRFIVNTDDNIAMFKMVIRFLCGLLSHDSKLVLYILYRYLLIKPIPMIHMPINYQLCFSSTTIHEYMGWIEFTQKFILISEILFESNSDSIFQSFHSYRELLPQSLCFYIDNSTSPNEWECFLRSLHLLDRIQLIHLDTQYVNISQFRSLLKNLTSCSSLGYLAVKFDKDYSTLTTYCDAIKSIQLSNDTKLSLELFDCDFSKSADIALAHSIFQPFTSISLYFTELSPQLLQQVATKLIFFNNLCIHPNLFDNSVQDMLLPLLNTATQLTCLHLYEIPTKHTQLLQAQLRLFSNLQEISLDGKTTHSLLPSISSLSGLKYLNLHSNLKPTDTGIKEHLLRLLNTNNNSLRGLRLSHLHSVGVNNCNEFLISIQSCTNLVEIELHDTVLLQDDVTLFGTAVSRLRSLLNLRLIRVTLPNSDISPLCIGLLYHPSIRCFEVKLCKLNSNCCVPLIHILPTLLTLKELNLEELGNKLSEPDPNPIKLLEQTANLYSVIL